MKPIPKLLLIHSAILKSVAEDMWQSESLATIAELSHIRIEPCSKLITDKQNRQVTLSATLFYDCRNSSPINVIFQQGQKIIFNELEYTVGTIELLYDAKKIHHYEIGLI